MSSSVEQIKERLNIVEVVSSYIKVEKAGINFKARCPFHNEKTPSLMISPARQSFYCFGCGEKGDVFSFVQKFENIEFKEALKTLADRAGIKLEKFNPEESAELNKENKEKEKLFEIMEEATKIYEEQLKDKTDILKYLEKRGLTEKSIKKWRLGFAEDEWRSLHDRLINRGAGKEEMLKAGLIKKTEKEDKYYDTFRNRIMFPICDPSGRVIAFSGRAMKETDKTPKYLNSPETKLFYKSETLYGFDVAKNHIRKMDYAVLVEGQLDLIMSHQANVLNTVASSGTALTELHLKKIKKLSNRAIVAYDCDEAGEKAAKKAAELALALGMEVKITSLPKGEDPASVIKENPEDWVKALKNSENLVDFLLHKALKEKEGANLTKEIIKNVLPAVTLVKSEIEKSQFVKKIAIKMKVSEEAVWEDIKKVTNGKKADFAKGFVEPMNEKDEKEELIFEAEKYGLKIDDEKAAKEIEKRNKLKNLKQRLIEITIELDDKDISKEEEINFKKEFEEIQKNIKEFSN